MKTVDKAMTVLDQFSFERTEIGLSELSRLAGLDKAATRRLLVALTEHGYVEQLADSKKYRLGYGFLRLSRIREATVPLVKAAQEVADWLTQISEETAHVSVPLSEGMATIAHQIPRRSNIINITPAELLPFHATAAGISFMAAATSKTCQQALSVKRIKTTPETLTSKSELIKKIKLTQENGFAHCFGTFESGVSSIAKPFFLDQADPSGTVSIALPDERMTEEHRKNLLPLLTEAVNRIELSLLG